MCVWFYSIHWQPPTKNREETQKYLFYIELKFFTFCFSKNLIWRNETAGLHFHCSLFLEPLLWQPECCWQDAPDANLGTILVWDLRSFPPILPPSVAPRPWCRSWQENRCGKAQSRGNIREKTSRKNTGEWRKGDRKIGKLMLFWVQSRIGFAYWITLLYMHNILLGPETRCKPRRSH